MKVFRSNASFITMLIQKCFKRLKKHVLAVLKALDRRSGSINYSS
jgi:hypothetical protein